MNQDIIDACVNLVDRAGASGFEIGHMHEDVHVEQAGWYAVAFYQGARITTDEHKSPELAALALAQRLLSGATCRCGRLVTLSDGEGCRWSLQGARWVPGCDAPPITVPGGRGDHAAMERALAEQVGNRAQRRAAARKGGRRA